VNKKKTIFLLRHGKIGFSGRYVGAMDVPLSSEGISQIEKLQVVFQDQNIDTIFTSPMLRCRQTCEIVFPEAVASCDDNLKEINFGRWEGLTFEEISSKDPGIVDRWAEDVADFTFPEGESVDLFNKRVQKFATGLRAGQSENIVVVCHGGVIRSLLCHFLGIDLRKYLLFQVNKGSYSTVELFGEQGVLTGLNLQ